MLKPPLLIAGDKVAIIAPAKKIQTDLTQAFAMLSNWGLVPVPGKHLYHTHDYFAGNDHQRLDDLQWALDNPEIKAILIARGGYGTTRILEEIDWSDFIRQPKWICGFSDLTSLHTLLSNKSIPTIHGPMAVTLDWDKLSTESLRKLLFDGKVNYHVPSHPLNQNGTTEAELIGGNLSILCNSLATASEINTDEKILFLEEVGEYLYHLDRMMVQLKRAGKLKNVTGMIIGDFSSMKDHTDSFGAEAYDILKTFTQSLKIPVAYGFPLGHEKKNFPVYCGIRAKLKVDTTGTNLTFEE